jgi:hypothetical protein
MIAGQRYSDHALKMVNENSQLEVIGGGQQSPVRAPFCLMMQTDCGLDCSTLRRIV